MKPLHNTYRIFALVMAFVIFATSVNIAIDMHYCKGELKSVSFFGKAKSCHSEIAPAMKNCPHHQKMRAESKDNYSADEKDCCNNKMVYIQSDLDQFNSSSKVVVSQELQQFVAAFIAVFFKNQIVEELSSTFLAYQPPIISRDISVLFQTFLI